MKPKSKFFLIPRHKSFKLGKSTLEFPPPNEGEWSGCWLINLIILFGILLAIFAAVVFSISLISGIWDFWRFETSGVNTVAVVTQCQMQPQGENNYAPELNYIYTVNSLDYENSHTITGRALDCDDFPIGTTLEARYLLNNPSHSKITQTEANPTLGYRIFFYSGFACFSVFMVAFVIWGLTDVIEYIIARRNYPILLKKGVLLDGEIVKAEREIRGRYTKFHYVKITYEFETPDGRILTRSLSRRREDLKGKELPAAGTPVTVLYADDFAVIVL